MNSTYGTLSFKPAPSGKDVGNFLVWLLAFVFILAGSITLTLRNPADGDTASDSTFLAVGWACIGIGFIIYFVKVYLAFRGKLW
jgi:hypothetical protein